MRVILNILWLVLAGFWLALGYAFAGIVMCILIITIPFGLQAFKLAAFALWPFGRTTVRTQDSAGRLIGNVIWIIFAGWWLALGHLITGVLQAITIIGLPLAVANWKMIPMSLTPFGREIVRVDDLRAAGTVWP
jgi:uncharacterized membrane protein YccF (DUF307 family)